MKIYVHMDLEHEEKKLFLDSFPESKIIFKEDFIHVKDVEIIIGNVPVSYIETAEQLRLIQTDSAGYDNYLALNWSELQNRGVTLGNMGNFYSLPVAEEVLAGIFTLLRNIPETLAEQRKKHWCSHILRPKKKNLSGKTVTMLGYGNIGKEIGRLLMPFHCTMYTLTSKDVDVSYTEKLIRAIDASSILISTIPYNKKNHNLLTYEILRQLGKDGIFVNVGRGGTVDEHAIVTLLTRKELRGVYLDVTQDEPIHSNSPLWSLDNIILSQHSAGGFEHEVREKVLFLIRAVEYFLKRERPMYEIDIVNYNKSYMRRDNED